MKNRLDALGVTERKPYEDRLAFELDVIIKMGFPGYFLIVSDFIKMVEEQQCARGAQARLWRGVICRVVAADYRS